jgi:hypothetical protein
MQIPLPIPRSSPLSTSCVPDLKGLAASLAIAVVCALLAAGAWRNAESIFLLFAGLGVVLAFFAAVTFALRLLSGSYGGSAICQTCFHTIEVKSGTQQNLLCAGCGTYYDAKTTTIEPVEAARVWHKPLYQVDLPPNEFRDLGTMSSASHPSLQALPLQDNDEVRLLMAAWPYGCCVCGEAATRFEDLLRKSEGQPDYYRGRIALLALGVPYCAKHSNGVTFEKPVVNSRGELVVAKLRFRSYASREAFRRSNFCKWSGSKTNRGRAR